MVVSIYRDSNMGRELIKRTVEEGYRDVQLVGIRMADIARNLIKVNYEEYSNSKMFIREGSHGTVDVVISFFESYFDMGSSTGKGITVHCRKEDVASSLEDLRSKRMSFDDIADFGLFDCAAALRRVAESRIITGCKFKELSLERSTVDENWAFNLVLL